MNRVRERIQREGAPLLGVAVNRCDPVFAEIAGHLGFQILWIEMEHAHISFGEAADLCRIASGVGMLTMIRIPDARRENVLKAAECGPDIIDLPMANSPDLLEEFVRHARYSPEGARGFIGSSRAMRYGLGGDIVEEQRRINQELCLMAQIETREAVERREELCSVPGIDIIFIGPGDLSTSLGVTGQTDHPAVQQAADQVIAAAKSHGKLLSMPSSPSDAGKWASKGVELLFCGSDLGCLKTGAQGILEQCRNTLRKGPG